MNGGVRLKKYLPLFLVILFPYALLFAVVCMFTGFLMGSVFDGFGFVPTLFVLYVAALACSLVVFTTSLARKRSALELLRMNMVIKIVHFPAYVAILILGLVYSLNIVTLFISVFLLTYYIIAILLTGLIGLCGAIRGSSEGKTSKIYAVIHGILQFIYCLDIVSAIIVYRKVKKSTQ